MIVFSRTRIFQLFLDILYGDESLEVEILINNQKLLDAVLLQNFFRLLQRSTDRNGDQVIFGHHLADQLRMIFFEAQIPVGENAGQSSAPRDWQAGNAIFRP